MTIPSDSAPVAGFQLEPEVAAQAIRELETAKAELESIRDDARHLANVNPTALDEVSRDAAIALGRAADGGPGSFVHAAGEGIARIEELIVALQASIDGYRDGDADVASSLR